MITWRKSRYSGDGGVGSQDCVEVGQVIVHEGVPEVQPER